MNNLFKRWYVQKCSSPDCWCRLIVTHEGARDMEDTIVHAGVLSEPEAAHIVELHNRTLGKPPRAKKEAAK